MHKSFCMWCGKSHGDNIPAYCADKSAKAQRKIDEGVPVWVLVAILDRYGQQVVDSDEEFFKAAAEMFGAGIPR